MYLDLVDSVMTDISETARQMVSALQRTSKLRTTTEGENVSMYSINSISPEKLGVEDAPNTISYITTPTIYLGQQQTRERDLWGALVNRLCAFQLIIAYYSVSMTDVAVIITY